MLSVQKPFQEIPYLGNMGKHEDDQDYTYDC